MKTFYCMILLALLHGTASAEMAPAASAPHRSALGSTVAIDSNDQLWMAYAEQADGGAIVKIARFDAVKGKWLAPKRINSTPEPVSSDGENRPKLAFGSLGEVYVTWTSPTSPKYTGDIRFARSLDGGKSWSTPAVVHRDRQVITHRFESMIVDRDGGIWVFWIDKRDLQLAASAQREYRGAAVYYAYSQDRGASWQGDFKLSDHSCECCRIALALDADGRVNVFWRGVFASNERDHALAVLDPNQPSKARISRVTHDRWRIEACPHHGPGLSIDEDGLRHAVWFNHVETQGRVFYGHLGDSGPTAVKQLPVGAMHADVMSSGATVAVAWKRFDGAATRLESWISEDRGQTFAAGPSLSARTDSDQPRLVAGAQGIYAVWRLPEGTRVVKMARPSIQRALPAPVSSKSSEPADDVRLAGFTNATLKEIESHYRGRPFWLVLWDLECTYCMKSLSNIARAQEVSPDLTIVTVTTDSIDQAAEINQRLQELGVRSEAYAFSGASAEALRYAIDPAWAGEKPRAYRYEADGKRSAISGVLPLQRLTAR